MYDVCAYSGDGDVSAMKTKACGVLREFAEACEDLEHTINSWKKLTGCCK